MTSAGRDSCDTVYHDAQSSAGEDTVSEQGCATDAGSDCTADGQSDWLSEIVGKAAAMRVHSKLMGTQCQVQDPPVRSPLGERVRAAGGFSQGGLGHPARLAARIITTMDALNQADKVQTYTHTDSHTHTEALAASLRGQPYLCNLLVGLCWGTHLQ